MDPMRHYDFNRPNNLTNARSQAAHEDLRGEACIQRDHVRQT